LQKEKSSNPTGSSKKKTKCPNAMESTSLIKNRSKHRRSRQITVQDIREMYSPGPSEVI
jgi:hypothetical protein